MDTLNKLQQQLGPTVQYQKDISHFLTLKTKTSAQYYFAADSRESIINAVTTAKELGISYFILAGGSNVAIVRDSIEGLVIHNKYFKKEIIDDTPEYTDIFFSSGYPMSRVVKETTEAGLSGFEYHLGLPGSMGGAIYMNSKWTKPINYCGDTLLYAHVLSNDNTVKKVDKEYFTFSYDFSSLQKTHEVFLDGVFRLKKEDPEIVKQRSQEALAYRKQTQPFGVATAGCFFQNITEEEKIQNNVPTTSAGYLIDHAGLKGKKIGAFVVSDIHANFIVNTGEGKPEDLHTLLNLIKTEVKNKYGVELREEVVVV